MTKEHRWIWKITGFMVGVAALPYLIGLSLTPRGAMFYGNTAVSPGDPSIYYSYIEQGRAGQVFMTDSFTGEPPRSVIFEPLWFVVGQAAEFFHLSTALIFFIARLGSVILLVHTLWWAIKWLWPDERRRRWGMWLTLGAGGFGWLAVAVTGHLMLNTTYITPDLWVSEAYTLLTTWGSPHFILVTSGILFVLVAVERSWLEHRWRLTLWAGLVALLVIAIHPFHSITWVVAWALLTIWRWVSSRQFPGGYAIRWLAVAAMASPLLLFYGLQLLFDPTIVGRAVQNINLTSPPWRVAIGLGLLLVGAVLGAWWWRPRDERWRWLVGLAIAYAVVIYLPLPFQRRLSHGMSIPLALLSVAALERWWQSVRKWGRGKRYVIGLVMGLALGGTWAVVLGWITSDYVLERQAPKHLYFISQEFQHYAGFVKQYIPPRQPILGTIIEGNILAGMTAHQVYAGYGVETLQFEKKLADLRWFLGGANQTTQRQFLLDQHLCYILNSPRLRTYGDAFRPEQWPDLVVAWRGPTLTLYHLSSCT